MIATNIQWDVYLDDILARLDKMTGKEIAETLEIPLEKYLNTTRNGLSAIVETQYMRNNHMLNKIMGLPDKVTIPNTVDTNDGITDWLSNTYGFCLKGYELENKNNQDDKKYILTLDGNYYAGRNEKYADMYNISGSGPIGAKQYSRKDAEALKDYYTKNGWEVTIEEYDPKKYLKKALEEILKYEKARADGKEIGYAIKNLAEDGLKYLKQVQ